MDQNKDKQVEISERLRLFFVRQKIKIVLITSTIFLLFISFSIMKIYKERENILYNQNNGKPPI